MKYISLHGSVYPEFVIFVKLMMYESILNFTYYNLYGGMMRGNYYINITLHFLYFQITITMSTGIMYQHDYKYKLCIKTALCTPYYILCCENEFNSIKLIYILFGVILVNYDLSKSVSKTVLEVYN